MFRLYSTVHALSSAELHTDLSRTFFNEITNNLRVVDTFLTVSRMLCVYVYVRTDH
jgi:hypothetical protein